MAKINANFPISNPVMQEQFNREVAARLNSDTVAATGGTPSVGEVPAGAIDSANVTYALAHTPIAGTLAVFLRGLRIKQTRDYSLTGSTLTMTTAPDTGDDLAVDYHY